MKAPDPPKSIPDQAPLPGQLFCVIEMLERATVAFAETGARWGPASRAVLHPIHNLPSGPTSLLLENPNTDSIPRCRPRHEDDLSVVQVANAYSAGADTLDTYVFFRHGTGGHLSA
jgi:hypothetical protein